MLTVAAPESASVQRTGKSWATFDSGPAHKPGRGSHRGVSGQVADPERQRAQLGSIVRHPEAVRGAERPDLTSADNRKALTDRCPRRAQGAVVTAFGGPRRWRAWAPQVDSAHRRGPGGPTQHPPPPPPSAWTSLQRSQVRSWARQPDGGGFKACHSARAEHALLQIEFDRPAPSAGPGGGVSDVVHNLRSISAPFT